MRIYADNAATTKTSEAAIKEMLKYLNEIYANPSSFIQTGRLLLKRYKMQGKELPTY